MQRVFRSFTGNHLQSATVFSEMYSVWLLDARHNPLHVENKMAVIFLAQFHSHKLSVKTAR